MLGTTVVTLQEAQCEESQEVTKDMLIAEAMGTGIIVHGGCGIVCAGKYLNPGLTLPAMAMVWGTSVALAVYVTRDISGAHLNPAVTMALAANMPDACDWNKAFQFIGAQTFGAAVAGGINYAIFNKAISNFEAAEGIKRGSKGSWSSFNGAFGMVPTKEIISVPKAFMAEIWMTSALVYLIFGLTDDKKTVPEGAAPALIGGAVMALVGMYGPVTGCGMNPARDLGPRLVTALAGWKGAAASPGWWIYTAGPVVGAVLGGAFYQMTHDKPFLGGFTGSSKENKQ